MAPRPPVHRDHLPSGVLARRMDAPELDPAIAARVHARFEGAEHVGTIWSPTRTHERRFLSVHRRDDRQWVAEIVDGEVVEVRER